MKSVDPCGEGLVKTRTNVMTNSTKLARRLLNAQCDANRGHVTLTNCRDGPCQRYIDEFCDEVCTAVKEELVERSCKNTCSMMTNLVVNTHEPGKVHLHEDGVAEYQELHMGHGILR